ncbi:MAG: alpha/beta fold hydrolase [Planctomycetota bacterium]|nr:alpha/beta fold hydrolase [Planctomycetota bacterium]
MTTTFRWGVVLLALAAGNLISFAGENAPKAEQLTFEGADGWALHGTLHLPAEAPAGAAICHPMLSKTRGTYDALVPKLLAKDLAVFAYDARGHGASVKGADGKARPGWDGRLGMDKEDLAFWAGLVDDLAKAKALIAEKLKLPGKRVALVGASVGANASLRLALKDADLGALVLLSPGENYCGLTSLDAAPALSVPLFVAMSERDPSSKDAPAKLFVGAEKLKVEDKALKRFPGNEHGTNLFAKHPELMDDLARWVGERVTGK